MFGVCESCVFALLTVHTRCTEKQDCCYFLRCSWQVLSWPPVFVLCL